MIRVFEEFEKKAQNFSQKLNKLTPIFFLADLRITNNLLLDPVQNLLGFDLFADNSDLPKFDIVYSLGFIEHFDEPVNVVARHLDLLKPGGILLLGVPNYGGIYRKVLKRMAPSIEQTHNMKTMDLENWKLFTEKLPIEPLFVNYIGGFEPLNMKKLEIKTISNKLIHNFVRILMVLFSFRMQFLRRFNSKYISGYLMGVYRKK